MTVYNPGHSLSQSTNTVPQWPHLMTFPTSITPQTQAQSLPILSCLAKARRSAARTLLLSWCVSWVVPGGLSCGPVSPDAVSICQGSLNYEQKQKRKDRVLVNKPFLPGGFRASLQNDQPFLDALGIKAKRGQYGVGHGEPPPLPKMS